MLTQELVYLVNAGNDPGMSAIANDHSFPALGVLALGTWLQAKIPDIKVVVRDGGVMANEAIIAEIARLRPGLVGVSALCTSYQSSLEIAQAAKDCGAKVVLGNDQASQLSRKILRNRPYVDFVLGSEYGERPLELLVRALRGEPIDLSRIPDLTYRQGGDICGFDYDTDRGLLSIVQTPAYDVKRRDTALDMFPIPDRSLYPDSHWQSYLDNYLDKFAALHGVPVTGVTTMNRARGCSRSKEAIKCKHCDMLLDIAFSSPEMFWAEVRQAHAQVGANVFYEVCDSFSSFPRLAERIARARPADLGFEPQFFVYCQAIDLVRSSDMARRLKDMGVFRVNIGLESGCDVTLNHMKGAHDTVAVNYRALQLVKEQGIHVYGSFVLGTDPETPATLGETVRWVKRIIDEELIADVEAQPILPLPNNYYGRRLASSALLESAERELDWPWDTDELAHRYIDAFSGVSYGQIIEAANEIRAYARAANLNFGSGVSRAEKYQQNATDLVPARERLRQA
ncbi:MAG TPA: radical SAM protein [Haliangium sp.]|nr:radical SAM protein [Haliangium sp.]